MSKKKDDEVSPAALLSISPKNRAYTTQRQDENGFRDIDGLHEELSERGETVSRATCGRANQYLKQEAKKSLLKAQDYRWFASGIGVDGTNISLKANIELQEALELTPEELNILKGAKQKILAELAELPPDDAIKGIKDWSDTLQKLSRTYKDLRATRRLDQQEALAQLAAIEQENNAKGKRTLDPETLRIINEEIYGLYEE